MKSIFIAILFCLSLVGCASTQKPEPTEKLVDRFVKVPKELTEKVKVSPPPNPSTYSVLAWDEKESLLFNIIQQRTTEVGVCNGRLNGIDAWSAKQALIYTTP